MVAGDDLTGTATWETSSTTGATSVHLDLQGKPTSNMQKLIADYIRGYAKASGWVASNFVWSRTRLTLTVRPRPPKKHRASSEKWKRKHRRLEDGRTPVPEATKN